MTGNNEVPGPEGPCAADGEASILLGLKWGVDRANQLLASLHPAPPEVWPEVAARLDRAAKDAHVTRGEFRYAAAVLPILRQIGLTPQAWKTSQQLGAGDLPAMAHAPSLGVFFVHQRNRDQSWLIESPDGLFHVQQFPDLAFFQPLRVAQGLRDNDSVTSLVSAALHEQRAVFLHAGLASALINLLGLFTSLYSMQVYDRVIPTQGVSTLLVLTIGVCLAMALELISRHARSALINRAIERIDLDLMRQIFARLLRIRMDQFPQSVGTLSAQMRSYESLRSFAANASLYLLVDTPLALAYLLMVLWIAGPLMALLPLCILALAVGLALLARWRITSTARRSDAASNRKLGLLVEAVDGAETIKATGAAWQLSARWATLARDSVREDRTIREDCESIGFFTNALQQFGYVMLVATGAYLASTGQELTAGSIIACSILSGRLLAPMTGLPGLMVQWAQARIALQTLEHIFALQQDHHGISSPMTLEQVGGRIDVSDLAFAYTSLSRPLAIAALTLQQGERVAVLGAVGSGKSTLLRLLAGLYAPQRGRVTLDGLDIQQMDRRQLSAQMGFLPQEFRLLSGSLRDNLLMGLPARSDEEILRTCQQTGLGALLDAHPRGLDLPVFESGGGISAGQRQLIALTRLLLARPDVWLLDEPTAHLDEGTEEQVVRVLDETAGTRQTMVIVTHRPALLTLVDRILVLVGNVIVLDGPREQVLQRLKHGSSGPCEQHVGAS